MDITTETRTANMQLNPCSSILVFVSTVYIVAVASIWLGACRTATRQWVAVGSALVTASISTYFVAGKATSITLILIASASLACIYAYTDFLHLIGLGITVAAAASRIMEQLVWASLVVQEGIVSVVRLPLGVLCLGRLLLLLPQLMDDYQNKEVICRSSWLRRSFSNQPAEANGIFISVHVPCYSEPPDVVIATLDFLSRQKYRNFEVLVIDNNTSDESLWRPVSRHCKSLGGRFKFHHVEQLNGAKAGALNYALPLSSHHAEIIAVVDADYQAEPHFLATLARHFGATGVDFVQFRHDYRTWGETGYSRACYWEYRYMYTTYMASRNEWNGALTAGTMCMIRRDALEAVGGWAQWCPTEDSELSIRLHAHGFQGLYIDECLGRGLIPETFAGYRRQRFRWVHGPALELRKHWRLYLPRRWSDPSSLSSAQKVIMAHHGLREVLGSIGQLSCLAGALSLALALGLTHSAVAISSATLWALAVAALCPLLVRWYVYLRIMGCDIRDAARAQIADASLTFIKYMAGAAGLMPLTVAFGRTNKFKARSVGLRAIRSALLEAVLCVCCLTTMVFADIAAPMCGLLQMATTMLAMAACGFAAAPYMAWWADHDLRGLPAVPKAVSRDRESRMNKTDAVVTSTDL
jgi:cellulose synthase/poly-beta-1,6-N-acetylglucosamine synthase-like glycosyltransferase